MSVVKVTGTDEFERAAFALRRMPKDLRTELYRSLNRATKGVRQDVKSGLPRYFPAQYATLLSKNLNIRPFVRLRDEARASITVKGRKKGRHVGSLNRGYLRHPLYGHNGFWYNQPVKPGFFTDPMEAKADEVRPEIRQAIVETANRLAERSD